MVKAPILKAQQDLSNLGKEPAAAPFDASGTTAITNKQLTILRVIADHRETLVALSASSSSSYAAWQVPVPDNLAGQHLNCRINAKTFDCGDQISVDLASGINAPAKPSTVSAASPTTPASAVPAQPSDNSSDAPAQTGTPSAPSGTTSANPAAPSATSSSTPAATASPGTATSAPAPASVRLGDTPSSGKPLSVSSDGTVSVNRDKVSGLKLDGTKPVWATRVEASRKLAGVSLPMSGDIWVVSDGVTVAGLDGSSVLWSSKLPEDVGALNTLGTEVVPRWQTSKGAIVMAYPDSLRALDPRHGSADLGPSLRRCSRPEGAQERGPRRPGYLRGGLQPRGSGMTRADIVEQAPEKTKVTFSDGKAAGTARGNGLGVGSSNTIATKSTQLGLFGTSPVMVAVLDCNADLPDYGFDVLVAYNADKEMVGSLMMEGSNEIGYVPAPHMENLRVVGGTVIFDEPQLRLYGDESCRTCGGSASATVTAQWDGQALTLADVVYHIPGSLPMSGDHRRPSLAEVQKVYDALAAKEDSKVTDQVDSAVLSSLDQPAGSTQAGDATARSAYLPKGGKVASCLLAGPKDSLFGTVVISEDLAPGSILCPITSEDQSKPWMQPLPNRRAQFEYGAWLILTPSEDGFKVTGLGHRRS